MTEFHPLVAEWFSRRFGTATVPQTDAWPELAAGRDVLVSAPTGSGKTLAAFLVCLDRLVRAGLKGDLTDRIHAVYVSPLKALSNDVQKNLEQPLAEIAALAESQGLALPKIRVALRTGDTSAYERQQMLRRAPHILVTTPESLFILLTSERGRVALRTTEAVVVDEIHAVVDDKRGAHLALSLARLDDLVVKAGGRRPQRIGLSATVRPIEPVAAFLQGTRAPESFRVVDSGHRRRLDLAVEVPGDELGPVATNEMWSDIYDRLAALIEAHRTTLVFVNTRRLAERITHHLAERLGDAAVLAHHGSLARRLRLDAEQRLKRGELRAVVATASLELGIDIGSVDLVCQIGSPRSIAVALQRVGRSGHTADPASIPKGRLFATTRDELVECAALVHAIRAGALDTLEFPEWPLDVLAQQIVAAAAAAGVDDPWTEDALYALVRGAHPYRDLPRRDFDAVVAMLSDGIATRRGRSGAFLHRDQVNGVVRGRRGARLAAITSGGAIPDNAQYFVVAEPEGAIVGTVDEDFAVESMAGDVFLLGSSSWRIRRVEAGRLRVEDAHGASPSIPFWRGEAPGRTVELSEEVSLVREAIVSEPDAVRWLMDECGVDRRGAEQAAVYVKSGAAAIGALPTHTRIVAERFFDEGGGMQLVLHAPFGARINRAWGLSLRKRFCRTFNFELQAAATDNGIVISLGEQHSFPLDMVFRFLHPASVEEVLRQALLDAPMFNARWRWNVSRSLAILRFSGGRKVPPPIQRMRSDDLLAAVFPDQAACGENLVGDIRIPDHPLVNETMRDCLQEAMDLERLKVMLRRMDSGEIALVAIDTAEPSPFTHEILNANPYAFLDDAPLEERRARAVQMRRTLGETGGDIGALDPSAIDAVAEESWPVVRDADELHDALLTLVAVPPRAEWQPFFEMLAASRRATMVRPAGGTGDVVEGVFWVAAERLTTAGLLYPDASPDPAIASFERTAPPNPEQAVAELLRGWLESTGPTLASAFALRLAISRESVDAALLQLEGEGQILRGRFTPDARPLDAEIEWCNRRLLARIHRLTLGRLRREIAPVTSADFARFLFAWQHVVPGSQLHGVQGVLQIIQQLQGYEISAAAWEGEVLPRRIAGYTPELLDQLCLSGDIMWGRLSPHPAFGADVTGDDDGTEARPRRRVRPTRVAPVAIFLREDAGWLLGHRSQTPDMTSALSHQARVVSDALNRQGASFLRDLVKSTRLLASEVEDALWELAAAGLVTADGFENLRSLVDPKRRNGEGRARWSRPRHATGRWALLSYEPSPADPQSEDARMETVARQLLRRWGVVFRDLLARETLVPVWRDLLLALRRLEARGEIRGGRFVGGFVGEQFALPQAVEVLRDVRRTASGKALVAAAADPLNLAGVITPGPRTSAVAGRLVEVLRASETVPAAS